MRPARQLTLAALLVSPLAFLAMATQSRQGPATGLAADTPQVIAYHTAPALSDPNQVPTYGLFEVTFAQARDYGAQANFDEIEIRLAFKGPENHRAEVTGFYYTTLAAGVSLWKARFAPPLAGPWTYRWTFVHRPSQRGQTGEGAFQVLPRREAGFLTTNPANPFQLLEANGQPFLPLGLNDCFTLDGVWHLDGGDRFGAFSGRQALYQYLESYAAAGFNMFRLTPGHCAATLADVTLTTYDPDAAMYLDQLMIHLRAHGIRVFYGLLGGQLPDDPPAPPPPAVERFLRYSVHRWGALVDVWELQNQRQASAEWIAAAAELVRAEDPYGHPISTHRERPELVSVDLNTPQWYTSEAPEAADQVLATQASAWREPGKAVIVGEQGNATPAGEQWGNWLPDSALRMRLRAWTALFNELGLLFWNNSAASNAAGGPTAGLYLGPEERQYAQVVGWFARVIAHPQLRQRPSAEARGLNPRRVRAYVLVSPDGVAVYLHHYADHEGFYYGDRLTINIPAAGMGYWIDPATATVWHRQPVTAGDNTLNIPTFQVDLAFFTTAASPFLAPPIAIIHYHNPQADGDPDGDGQNDHGPRQVPFGRPGLTLTLDARGSASPNGTNLSYRWDFGDGSPPSDAPVVEHSYPRGHFQTTLTVTDAAGGSSRAHLFVRASADPQPDQNDPPTLALPAEIHARVGELVVIPAIGSDRELVGGRYRGETLNPDPLDYEASGLPPGAKFGPWGDSLPRLWWVPGLQQAGTHEIHITAVDPDGDRSPRRTVRLVVRDAAEAGRGTPLPTPTPAISHTPPPTATPGPVLLPHASKPEPPTPTPAASPTPEDSTEAWGGGVRGDRGVKHPRVYHPAWAKRSSPTATASRRLSAMKGTRPRNLKEAPCPRPTPVRITAPAPAPWAAPFLGASWPSPSSSWRL